MLEQRTRPQSVSGLARALEIDRSTLYRMARRHGLMYLLRRRM